MAAPAGSIRTELNRALVGGIRQRGPEAVGLILVGAARLLLAFLAVVFTQALSVTVLGLGLGSTPSMTISVLSAAASVLASATWPRRPR
jgi:hypothetical protein